MNFDFSATTLMLGFLIFFARIADVSLGTLRTISIVHGRKLMAFSLGFVEILIWLSVISTVIQQIGSSPLLGLFYSFGFATGSLVGIQIEQWIALGCIILRVISRKEPEKLTEIIRGEGFAVTTFAGKGKEGPVMELYIVCRRRDLRKILQVVHSIEPDAFYITERTGAVSKLYRPTMQSSTGWRSILKKK